MTSSVLLNNWKDPLLLKLLSLRSMVNVKGSDCSLCVFQKISCDTVVLGTVGQCDGYVYTSVCLYFWGLCALESQVSCLSRMVELKAKSIGVSSLSNGGRQPATFTFGRIWHDRDSENSVVLCWTNLRHHFCISMSNSFQLNGHIGPSAISGVGGTHWVVG